MDCMEPQSPDPSVCDDAAIQEWLETVGMHWRDMSPELCAARYSHRIHCFGLDAIRISDPELAQWLRRFGEIWANDAEAKRVRREQLTGEEHTRVLREMASCRREMKERGVDTHDG
jgi:hypothetical protein